MIERFSDKTTAIMRLANENAKKCNQEKIRTEDILVGVLEENSSSSYQILNKYHINVEEIKKEIPFNKENLFTLGRLSNSKEVNLVLERALEYSDQTKSDIIDPEHLIYGLLSEENTASQILKKRGLSLNKYVDELRDIKTSKQTKIQKSEPKEPLPIENKQIKETPKKPILDLPGFWVIPKKSMALEDVLKLHNYDVETRSGFIEVCDKDKEYLLGKIKLENKEYAIEINYPLDNLERVSQLVDFAEILKKNNVKITESPNRYVLERELKKTISSTTDLISRIERIN